MKLQTLTQKLYFPCAPVFTPPKHTAMCVYTSSKMEGGEVVAALLDKYKIETSPGDYALYLVR